MRPGHLNYISGKIAAGAETRITKCSERNFLRFFLFDIDFSGDNHGDRQLNGLLRG